MYGPLVKGSWDQALQALAAREVELRLRPITWREKRSGEISDFMSSIGNWWGNNLPAGYGIAGAGLGALAGAGTAALGNRGKTKADKLPLWRSALLGALGGGALGAGGTLALQHGSELLNPEAQQVVHKGLTAGPSGIVMAAGGDRSFSDDAGVNAPSPRAETSSTGPSSGWELGLGMKNQLPAAAGATAAALAARAAWRSRLNLGSLPFLGPVLGGRVNPQRSTDPSFNRSALNALANDANTSQDMKKALSSLTADTKTFTELVTRRRPGTGSWAGFSRGDIPVTFEETPAVAAKPAKSVRVGGKKVKVPAVPAVDAVLKTVNITPGQIEHGRQLAHDAATGATKLTNPTRIRMPFSGSKLVPSGITGRGAVAFGVPLAAILALRESGNMTSKSQAAIQRMAVKRYLEEGRSLTDANGKYIGPRMSTP